MLFGLCCFWFEAQILFCLRMSRAGMILFVDCGCGVEIAVGCEVFMLLLSRSSFVSKMLLNVLISFLRLFVLVLVKRCGRQYPMPSWSVSWIVSGI